MVQLIFFLWMPALFSQAFSGMKETVSLIAKGEVLELSVFVLRLLILCGVTIVFGRIFCGWACAFGALGDWLYFLSDFLQKKIRKKFPTLPSKAMPYLQKIKYLVLASLVVFCFLGESDQITKNSPWTIFSLVTARHPMFIKYPVATGLLVLIIVGMVFQERFFCQIICPMGAIFSLLPELPLFRLKRKPEQCIKGCQACRNHCPVQIKLGEEALQDGECIRCGRCTQNCPKGNISV